MEELERINQHTHTEAKKVLYLSAWLELFAFRKDTFVIVYVILPTMFGPVALGSAVELLLIDSGSY